MVSYLDYTSPDTKFAFDVNTSRFFTGNESNFINVMGIDQLNTLENISLLDIFLSQNKVIEPHYHQNAAELVYCISGMAVVSLLNPFSKRIQSYKITSGQVTNIPQGWWHYEIAGMNRTHLLAIFDAPTPEVIFGSDILRLTPAEIMAHTYCLNQAQWQQVISPITDTTVIGPSDSCGMGTSSAAGSANIGNKRQVSRPNPAPQQPVDYFYPYPIYH